MRPLRGCVSHGAEAPVLLKHVGAQDWQSCKEYNIMDCMECRCCEYICSSKLPLVTMIKMGKNGVRGLK